MQKLLHPFMGHDHLLVMVAVGFWATRQRNLGSTILLPHGMAHVAEAGTLSMLPVIAMMSGSALLHALGLTLSIWTRSQGLTCFYRLTGAGLIVAGTGLVVVTV
ncbi:HupE/UreJ family protein [Thiogranum longum]|uniref:HupE/UreJ family protein n=1 Tax=Thiogranum longum TaxID=1537524 RepID=UPI001FB4D41C|nr:HupE/UreJ family protein [Thiogranum longum]